MSPEPLSSDAVLPWEADLAIDPAEPGLPGVSVVIPVFNAGDFLEKTLRSLLCSDLSGVEVILMDGASADATPKIVERYRDMFAVAVSEPDRGQSDAINKGFARATKPILHWLNGDDLLLPNALTKVRRAFRDHPGTEVVVGDAYMTEKDFTPIRHFVFSPETLRLRRLLDYARNHLVQPSVFFSRAAWEAAGPVKEKLHYAMDADLFLGMAAKFEFHHLEADLAYSVYHEACKTRGKRGESITELALVQARHGGFDEAQATLDILVELFKTAEARAETAAAEGARPRWDTGDYALVKRRAEALETEREKTLALLVDRDLRATG